MTKEVVVFFFSKLRNWYDLAKLDQFVNTLNK